ncbi:MAG: hypothetical protein K2N44_09295, partial [Lachnospiraceae bacterium]|nr:hypothetical protein [Lachnospiraceae bacterium]
TDAQGDIKVQYSSNRKKAGNSNGDEASERLNKGGKNNLDKNAGKGGSVEKGKSFANEGIYIEDGYDLGELIGKGGNKEVYLFGDDKVIAITQDGKPLTSIDKEISMLRQLDELGLPVINAEKVIVDGKPGILMDRCAQDSKSIVALDKTKGKVMLKPNADTSLLNQNSIDDLTKIKQIMNNDKIKINDLQFLIKEDGHIVIADPLDVIVGQLPSKNNNKMLDILIEEAKKNR